MGGAMLQRWKDLNLYQSVYVVEPTSIASLAAPQVDSRDRLPASFEPDVLVFAVKPQILPDILGEYRAYTDAGALAISIAAGRTLHFFENILGTPSKIVRAMPNTPASIGQGITVACANKNIGSGEKAVTEELLESVGDVIWVEKEELLNPVTALSGSGPAYVFLLIEVLTKAGINIGLTPDMAEKLARQTVIGSGALAEASPQVSAQKLRENVTSPGGTTQAALDVLLPSDLQKIFDAALTAATHRAKELSE